MGLFEDISARHERLKHRIHNFKIPLSRRGQIVMNFVYFTVPVMAGTYWIGNLNGKAERNLKRAGVLPKSYGTPQEDREGLMTGPHSKELEKVPEKSIKDGMK